MRLDAAVMIPIAMIQLNKSNAALSQTARQQAIGCKAAVAPAGSIHVQHVLRLVGNIHQIGNAGLHSKGHLVLADPRGDFGIVRFASLDLIQSSDSVDDVALLLSVMAGPDERDAASLPEPGAAFGQVPARDLAGVRIAWSERLGRYPVERRVTDVCNSARAVFTALGCDVADAEPDLDGVDCVLVRPLRGRDALVAKPVRGGPGRVLARATNLYSPSWRPICTVFGSERAEWLRGTGIRDLVCGRGGDDTAWSGPGNDLVYGDRWRFQSRAIVFMGE